MLDLGLGQLVNVLASLQSQAVRVHPRQCTRVRHRLSTCTLCADHCPAKAISWQGQALEVDPAKCTGCGVCAAVCPVGALEAQSPADGELVAQIQERLKACQYLAFACPRYLDGRGGEGKAFMRVSCLGRLDESVLVAAVALGARAVWLVDGACADCPQASAREVAVRALQRANALLRAWGRGDALAMGPELPDAWQAVLPVAGPVDGLSRRAFFGALRQGTVRKAAVAVSSILDGQRAEEDAAPRKGELPTRLPVRRQLLLAALRRLGQPRAGRVAGGLWAQVLLNDDCTGCRMCAFFCPTGALAREGEGLAFRLANCTNCRLCVEVCYRQALSLSPAVDTARVLSDQAEMLPLPCQGAGAARTPLQETIARRILGAGDSKSE